MGFAGCSAQDVGRDTVGETLAGLVGEREAGDARHEVRERRRLREPRVVVELLDGAVAEVVGEARRVGEEVLDRDGVLGVGEEGLLRRPARQDLHVGELRQVVPDRVVELEPRLLEQDERSDAGEDLRHRVDAADRVPLHGEAGPDVAHPIGLPIHDPPVAGHQGDGARVLALRE